MKPVKLVIEGINSFTDAQTLDFEAVGRSNLFCISGKTGAGKTTIFDSIMLALYGRSGKGNLADVVNLSRMSARVVFDFTENGDLYTVERVIECKFEKNDDGEETDKRVIKKTDCMLYKNGEPLAVGSDAASVYISEIIGLGESEFKNVYLLEQGEYADFLKKTPAKQTEAVGKIFSLMRFGDVYALANAKAKTCADKADILEKSMLAKGDISQKKLRDEKSELASLKARTTNIIKETEAKRAEIDALQKVRDEYISACEKQDEVKKLMIRADEARKKTYFAEQALAQFESAVDPSHENKLADYREKLNALSALNSIDREYAAAVKESERKSGIAESKREELADKEKKHAELVKIAAADAEKYDGLVSEIRAAADCPNGSETLARAKTASTTAEMIDLRHALAGELDRYGELVRELDNAKAASEQKTKAKANQLEIIGKYETELRSLAQERAAVEEKDRAARAALGAAQLCSHAAAVRAELHDGDVCPVCGGKYGGFGADGVETDVEKCKRDCEIAKAELSAAVASEAECVKHSDRAKSEYDRIDGEARALYEKTAELSARIDSTKVDPDIYAKVIALLEKADAAGAGAQKSVERIRASEPVLSAAKAEAGAAGVAAREAAAKTEDYRARLGENCGKTDGMIGEVKRLTAELEQKISQTQAARKKLTAELDTARAEESTLKNLLEAKRADCPVDMPEFDESGYIERKEELERLNRQIAQNEKDIAVKEVEIKSLSDDLDELEKLSAESGEHKKQAKIFAEIAALTKGKAMLNYVAEEYIDLFTSSASEILSVLSGGKYTMSYDSENGFTVSDFLNDGKTRKTDTLSGGELFMASLSVAIAIARTQSRGNNGFFFLDEGFGTLDDELIDTVYGALESLSEDCLVGVISHAGALIERMPACVEVTEASDTVGSRIKY